MAAHAYTLRPRLQPEHLAQVPPLRQQQLGAHEVGARDLLRHRVLDLQARVDLQQQGVGAPGG